MKPTLSNMIIFLNKANTPRSHCSEMLLSFVVINFFARKRFRYQELKYCNLWSASVTQNKDVVLSIGQSDFNGLLLENAIVCSGIKRYVMSEQSNFKIFFMFLFLTSLTLADVVKSVRAQSESLKVGSTNLFFEKKVVWLNSSNYF